MSDDREKGRAGGGRKGRGGRVKVRGSQGAVGTNKVSNLKKSERVEVKPQRKKRQ